MNMKIRVFLVFLGYVLCFSSVIFFIAFSLIVTGTKGENFSRDLLGFPIPHPPEWVSFIPYLWIFISFIFESFSIHGLVQFGIMLGTLSIGSILVGLGKDEVSIDGVTPKKQSGKHSLKSFLENYIKQNLDYELPVLVGVDDSGVEMFADLEDLGHILMSGQTGAGKSKFGHNIIASLLILKKNEINLLLLDLKAVEFSVYRDQPNLITQPIRNTREAFEELEKLTKECERRLKKYKFKHNYPHIVVLIDTFSDMVLSDKARFETVMMKLTKNSKQTGVHLVMWDSRLAPEIFTPTIRSVFPTKISFRLPYTPNSPLIMEGYDETKLSASGDMFMTISNQSPIHLYAPVITDLETQTIVKNMKQ